MSEVVYHRCDMCGDLIVDETKMGYFNSPHWLSGEADFELCEKCSVKVQRFIREYGMCNGYRSDIEKRTGAVGEVRNSCEAEEDAHGC